VFQISASDPGFNGGVFTIAPRTPLPAITDALTIDGSTQTAFTGNTNVAGPEVVLDGALAGGDGLEVAAGDSIIQGLAIGRVRANGVAIAGSRNTLQSCYIGTDAAGNTALGNGLLSGGAGILLGGFGNTIANSLISGNGGPGISIAGTGNVVRGN